LLVELFPDQAINVVEATLLAAFVQNVRGKRVAAEAINAWYGDDMAAYNAAVSTFGMQPPTPWWVKAFRWAGAGLAIAGGLLWLRRVVSAAWGAGKILPVGAGATAPGEDIPVRVLSLQEAVVAVLPALWNPRGFLAEGLAWLTEKVTSRVGKGLVAYGRTESILNLLTDVVGEEAIKEFTPWGHYWFPAVELALKVALAPAPLRAVTLLGGIPAVCVHLAIKDLPFWKRVGLHFVWDFACFWVMGEAIATVPAVAMMRTRWQVHREHYFETPWEQRVSWPNADNPGVYPFEPEEGCIRREARSHFEEKPLDKEMKVKGKIPIDPEEQSSTFVYYILPTQIPVYAPGRTDANLLAVISGRLCLAPPLEPSIQREHWAQFQFVPPSLIGDPHPPLNWEDHVDEWYAHITEGFKRKRAKRALQVLRDNWISKKDKVTLVNQVIAKTDEVLLKCGEEGVGLKPRPVVNVDPLVQARTGPELYKAAERLHEEWSWSWVERKGVILAPDSGDWVEVRMTFGSNATDVLLSDWMREALEWHPLNGVWILMAGDDSLVFIYQSGRLAVIWEGDFSMYDQSQSWGPLFAEMAVLKALGVSEEARDLLLRSSLAKIVAKGKRGDKVAIRHLHRPMRVTGGADTTVGNTITGVVGWVIVCGGLDWKKPAGDQTDWVVERFAWLGFALKLRAIHDPTEASFLKGLWVEIQDRLVWAPAPSRILKLGKALSDPCVLYPRRSRREAGAQFLNDVAASYRNFAQVPGVGGFVRRYYQRAPERDLLVSEPWKVASGFPRSPGVPEELSGMAKRYGLAEEDLWSLDTLVEGSTAYSLIVHPACAALARMDYN
jgi:hypothetical protein